MGRQSMVFSLYSIAAHRVSYIKNSNRCEYYSDIFCTVGRVEDGEVAPAGVIFPEGKIFI